MVRLIVKIVTFYRECNWSSCCRWRERRLTCRRAGSPARTCLNNRSTWWRKAARCPPRSADCTRCFVSSLLRISLERDASAHFAQRGQSSCDPDIIRCWVAVGIAAAWVIFWPASSKPWTLSAGSSANDSADSIAAAVAFAVVLE